MIRILGYALLVVGVLGVTLWFARDLPPPDRVRFAAGVEGNGYWRIAERYRDILARDGITLDLVATAGSVENAELLARGAVDAALLQGGIEPDATVETLGAVFTEPLLVFARVNPSGGDAAGASVADRPVPIPRNVAEWAGLRIAAGGEGSGTRAAVRGLLAAAGVPEADNALLPLGGADAARALAAGEADVAVFVAPLSAPYLQPILADPGVTLLPLAHVAALSRRMEQARIVDVPSGTFSLDPPLPAEDLRLLGLVARIVALPGLHPAAVDRIVEAAIRLHGPGDVLTPAGTYPSMDETALPQDSYARDLLADGPSVFADILPYWIVAQINRFAILLLPIVFLLLPLLRALPGLYAFRVRSRVFRHYARIRRIEAEAARATDAAQLEDLRTELREIDGEIARLKLPLAYRDYAYNARLHIDLLLNRIATRG
ncbi:TAXI family TRAP transporter solute-binding subunit [uncultured Jannaschia sp.]|uniref:TAXI family TRAP transporter solute-binding subunit n=1 Tax=uncultured Jannaschia sp. TaxID=293347 RepID=UPI00260C7708|nr:TAXI family TRAP transporter solute-binding subunit [uncultured Jannaschia sp.]